MSPTHTIQKSYACIHAKNSTSSNPVLFPIQLELIIISLIQIQLYLYTDHVMGSKSRHPDRNFKIEIISISIYTYIMQRQSMHVSLFYQITLQYYLIIQNNIALDRVFYYTVFHGHPFLFQQSISLGLYYFIIRMTCLRRGQGGL